MKIRRIAAFALALAVSSGVAAAPSAADKGGGGVRVIDVSGAPSSVQAGGALTVSGKVRNEGRRADTTRVKAFLEGRGREVRIGSVSVRVDAGRTKTFSITGTVPRSLGAGSYKLFACVRDDGRERCKRGGNIDVTDRVYSPGSRSLGDPLFPQTGNGGYDARSYDLDIDYDPAANFFDSARTTMRATATQNLSSFSLDFQDMDVSSVTVNGRSAAFEQVLAEPPLGDPAEVTQLMKLVVTPSRPIDSGDRFTVRVRYSGTPVRITDVDTSFEGWIPACYGPGQTPPCDGGFVVNEPNGAQGWFPSNNYPTDKATFETTITVPQTHKAFGVGELESRTASDDGTWTWSWSEDDPISTYLTTATVGLFDYSVEGMEETSTGRVLPMYFAIDSTFTQPQKDGVTAIFDETESMTNYLSDLYGPYPFDSTGGVQDRTVGVGYALEVATKPHYASLGSNSASTHLHELAHQWFGNTATLEQWTDIWFNEGWAQWSEWIWGYETQGGDDPAVLFDELYAETEEEEWEVPPATLNGDATLLFSGFPQYDRGSMVVQATSEILGEDAFAELIERLMTDYRYGNISTPEFISLAMEVSGFSGAQLDLLSEFYDEWLYGDEKPTILPEHVTGAMRSGSAAAAAGGEAVEVPRDGQR